MANVFDQFDKQEAPSGANVFTQFDETPPPVSRETPPPEYTPIPPVQAEPSMYEKFMKAGIQIPRLFMEVMGGPPMKALLEPGKLESEAVAGSGMIAEPVAGLAGIAALPAGPETAGQVVEATRGALTIPPITQAGREAVQQAAESPVLQTIGKGLQAAEEWTGEKGYEMGGPLGGALGQAAPTAIMELIGFKGLRSIRQGTRLLDANGNPTKVLRKALDKQGLIYEDLTPEARAAIPEIADSSLGEGLNIPKDFSEKALKEQIKSGGRSTELAPYRVVNDEVVIDRAAKEAIRQGFEPDAIQMVKTATPETRSKMKMMLDRMRMIKKNASEARNRPSDIAGDALTDRIKFIRDKAETARKKLNEIAQYKLKGKPIDTQRVTNTLDEALNDLDVQLDYSGGVPKPMYEGSLISKDRTSQRVVNDLIDLMAEPKAPDALRAHKLKRQLDILIDFNKKSAEGLTDAGKKVLKKVRHELNQVVRDVDTDYAKVNDILADSLDAFDQLDSAVGTIDIFGAKSDAALGTRLRTLTSNYASRQKLENALSAIDETVKKLGGKFGDDLYDLNMFASELDRRFGAVAKTSFQGQIEAAQEARAFRQGPVSAAKEKAAEAGIGAVQKMRGVNDFNAFESLDALLKRAK